MKRIETYACYNKNKNTRLGSSSGAVFSLLAESVLEKNGIVYGVTMSEDCYAAIFIGITSKDDIPKLRGSKYLQADLGNTYRMIRQNLLDGKLVLFSGTGCQINGLKKFLADEYENLICVDVICHGTPSPKLWEKYVRYQESKYNSKLRYINFRCKYDSWQEFGMQEGLKHISKNDWKQVYISKDVDSYMQMFLRNYCLRPSCYNCIAKEIKMSDITIADFWGIENVAPEMNDGMGTSLVLIRTEMGKMVFEHISTKMKVREVSYEDGVRGNPSEYSSVKRPPERDAFFENMRGMSFEQLEKMYNLPARVSLKNKLKKRVKKMLEPIFGGGSNADYGLLFVFYI